MGGHLTERIWHLDLDYVNAYLVDDDVLTLIDAGLPWSGSTIKSEIRAAGFEPAQVERILVTHYDFDHVGALTAVPGSPEIIVGAGDLDLVAGRTVPGLSGVKQAIQRFGAVFLTPPNRPLSTVKDGDEIGSFTAIHTPGHSPGHVAYVSEARDVAFIGDLLRSDGETLSRPPWYLNRDTVRIDHSVERLLDRLPPVEIVAPGHGEPLVQGCQQAIRALRTRT
ncbi:MBL fold metallo-hydrolase [Halodesulfurarchaeum sp.]|uniref:MBL fold metallo-hydrolase n=1 Tax=Halodesulfurarchaeum sp. TaxID=1980530 RepID=UPI002FC2EDAE